jgi:xanthine/CO dehydrogenase XdhC/CoxF family maturation factor
MVTLLRVEKPGAGATFGSLVAGIAERAILERQTATTDAAAQLVAKLGQQRDAPIEVRFPCHGEIVPILDRGRSALRQLRQRGAIDTRGTPMRCATLMMAMRRRTSRP